MDPDDSILEPLPSVFNYVLSFLLVGVAWGFTTPFIRRAAADFNARQEAQAQQQSNPRSEEEEGQGEEAEEEEVPLQPRTRTRQGGRQGKDTKDEDDIGIENENDNEDQDQDQDEVEDEDEDQPPTSAIPPTSTTPAWMKPSSSSSSWLKQKITTLFWTVFNLLRTPAYSIPLVINLTGSIWFFLLVGKHGMFFFWLSLV